MSLSWSLAFTDNKDDLIYFFTLSNLHHELNQFYFVAMLFRLNDTSHNVPYLFIAVISEYSKILANSVLLYTYKSVSDKYGP